MSKTLREELAELKQEILNCRGLWALIHKWTGPTKAFRLGQITYRIYEVAKEVFGGATVEGQGSTSQENRLSVACQDLSNDLFDEVDKAIHAFKESIKDKPDLLESRGHMVEGFERSVACLKKSSGELQEKAKVIEQELHSIIQLIDLFM